MVKQLETRFKRIETKYVVSKENLEDLLADLKEYLVEDDYPTSTISNIYFDTDNFDVIQDALDGNHHKSESLFKATGRALREAITVNPDIHGVNSTKGML